MKKFASIIFALVASVAMGDVFVSYSFDYSNATFKVTQDSSYMAQLVLNVTNVLDDTRSSSFTYPNVPLSTGTNELCVTTSDLVPGETYAYQIEAKQTESGDSKWYSGTFTLAADTTWFSFYSGTPPVFTNAITNAYATVDEQGRLVPEDDCCMTLTPIVPATNDVRQVLLLDADFEAASEQSDLDKLTNCCNAITLSTQGWKCSIPTTVGDKLTNTWVAITNENVECVAGSYAIKAEINCTTAEPTISYYISSTNDHSVFYLMSAVSGGDVSFPFHATNTVHKKLNRVGFTGAGALSKLEAWQRKAEPATEVKIVDNKIILESNTNVDLSKVNAGTYSVEGLENYAMSWSDANGKYAYVEDDKLVVAEGSPANGYPSYVSYVLGLDATEADSKPLLDSAQNGEANELTFSVANVIPKTDIADVKFSLVTSDGTSGAGTTTEFGSGGEATATLDPAKVQFYRVEIKVKTK